MKPRMTSLWQKQRAALVGGIGGLFADDEFARLFSASVGFLVSGWRVHQDSIRRAQALAAVGSLGDAAIVQARALKLDKVQETFWDTFVPALAGAAKSAGPEFAHMLGWCRLQTYLAAVVLAVVVHGDAGEEAALGLLDQGLPNTLLHLGANPLAILSADAGLIAGETEDVRHYMEIAAYQRSLRPAGRHGRHKKAPKTRGSGRLPIDLAEAVAVRAMRREGASLKEIAARFWPSEDPTSSRLRARIARRIQLADLHD